MSDIHPNIVAYIVLLGWPVVALFLYKSLSIAQATLWTILGGYLLLPMGFEIKFEMIPGFSKTSIPCLAALLGCALFARTLPKFSYGFGPAETLALFVLIGPFITSMLNTDPIQVGGTVQPGVGAYDAGSAAVAQLIFMLPFFLGRQYLRSADDNAEILRVMAIAGLAYSLLMLIEVRMSPQLSNWVYGYTYRSVGVAARYGGFRPVVFLTGLWVAFFTVTATVAAAALWRTQTRVVRMPPGWVTGYLGAMLVLCKTLGALVYGVVLVPLVRWASPRFQLRVACIFVVIALSYPILRVADLVPTDSILAAADTVSADRAASLRTRFTWEHRLLEHAWKRPWFGWGRYGRSRVVEDQGSQDLTVADGYWIIMTGTFGLFGFAARFGLLGLAVFHAASALKFAQSPRESLWLAALALIIGINMIDLLPNSSMSPWTWLLAGALLGRAEALREARTQNVRFQREGLLIGRSTS